MKFKYFLLLVFLHISGYCTAQKKPDTLTFDQFNKIVSSYHPIALQANLLNDFAKAKFAQARGGFDPKLSLNYDEKEYGGTNYYRFLTPEVKLPLWYGIEIKSSYSEAEGVYINPENKLPKDGLSYLGINLSLGKGLFIDARRAAIKQAQIFNGASKIEQKKIMNDLIFEAVAAYLNWQNNYKLTKVFEQSLDLSKIRYNAIKASLAGGDRPAVDTLEMLTQIQQRQIQLQQANLNLQNSFFEISTFLWLEDCKPYPVEKLMLVPDEREIKLTTNENITISNNPKLLSFNYKIKDLQLEKRLKEENLKPVLDLQLGILNGGNNAFRNLNANYWRNNNKIGFQIAFPLTFQKERGQIAEIKLKLIDTSLEQELLKNDLFVKYNQNLVEREALKTQLNMISESVLTNKKLLTAEEMKFRFGDSSVFLINARESKLVESTEKLLETENKLRKNKLKADWLLGNLTN